jgi:hypothetical protein
MPKPKSIESELFPDQESLQSIKIDQWIENLQRADRSFYNMMALEVWSIAKTMDGLIPGFWSRFMTNRQIALKQFMQQKTIQRSNGEVAESEE